MVLQTQAAILTVLMANDCRQDEQVFADAVKDALIMAREAALNTIPDDAVSNDRTFLKHQR